MKSIYKKIVKYLFFCLTLWLSLIMIPRDEINWKDMITILSVIMSLFVILDLYMPTIDLETFENKIDN